MTAPSLRELKRLAEAATPGPWTSKAVCFAGRAR